MKKHQLAVLFVVVSSAAVSVQAQPTPPDLSVCAAQTCEDLPTSLCSEGGFKITLTDYTEASSTTAGSASYTYEVCSPAAGICAGGDGLRAGESCVQNDFCRSKGQDTDIDAYCTRECAVDAFRGLSHFDALFPELGTESCLSDTTTVTVSCEGTGEPTLGDGSCFDGGASSSFVAKCDNTDLAVGACMSMTVTIAGELTGLGLGQSIVVDKESTSCTASCLAGPSCEPCDEPPPEGGACLTRTLGFWGTHPWITNDYVPVTVCGYPLTCAGAADGMSSPSCQAGTCDSVMEALGSSPGLELRTNQSYVAMVKQLAAAKLNLNATAALFEGAACSDFSYEGKSISTWIAECELLCGASRAIITNSGCIAALDAFNNSEDTGFEQTPSPFDRPPVDDFGNVSGADSRAFQAAQGHSSKLVIGKRTRDADCR